MATKHLFAGTADAWSYEQIETTTYADAKRTYIDGLKKLIDYDRAVHFAKCEYCKKHVSKCGCGASQ